jgi:hypothetical protein
MRAPGRIRDHARLLHADEQVAEDFDVWTDLLSRRAAVLWVLKSVYVRVLEDRGLLNPGRLLDPEAQQLFERLAPHLGETAFLRWVYRDLASALGGVPELFSPLPAEVAFPSDQLSRALIAFWRHRDADTGANWSFADEHFEGELMGDLYQDLDPVVKDRFALCQTPDFVREFILDRTLTPAIETFGADQVRLLDPACGSGHFLIDGLKRLVAATAAQRPDWTRDKIVDHALDRVVGIDLNDYACALARTRLVMTAAELVGVTTLEDAARFHPKVYWADGLEQVEREEAKPSTQLALFERVEAGPRATLTRSDVRIALTTVLATKFQAVVANPPYIVESDEARKAYHREKCGGQQRYVSAYRQYSLASPFTERCFQLAERDGYVGIIASNNFMKREFGKPLIEKVLSGVDLSLIVDASHARIPFHETPTVLLFGRNRRPVDSMVRAVMAKRGESGIIGEVLPGRVWQSIVEGWNQVGFENEFLSVAEVSRATLAKYPWSLGGGGAQQLRESIDAASTKRLAALDVDIGRTMHTGLDDAFYVPTHVARRLGRRVLPLVRGADVRDWNVTSEEQVVTPYNLETLQTLSEEELGVETLRLLWRNKTPLAARSDYGKSLSERALRWFEWSMFFRYRLASPLGISYPVVAAHNHFALCRQPMVFNSKAPVIKLPKGATEDDYLALLGLLNSSVACFWMKQVFYPKGSATHDVSKGGLMPENNTFEFAATGLLKFPLPDELEDSRLVSYARELDRLGNTRLLLDPSTVLAHGDNLLTPEGLRSALSDAEAQDNDALARMVYFQEELDWLCYAKYGLVSASLARPSTPAEIDASHRPFSVPDPRVWSQLPQDLAELYSERLRAIGGIPMLALLEGPVYKRQWRGRQGIFGRYDRTYAERAQTAMRAWLATRVEDAARERGCPFSLGQMVAWLQDDPKLLAVCEALTDRRDFDLSQIIADAIFGDTAPNHPHHTYTASGLVKRGVWERTWEAQHRQDAAEKVTPEMPPSYGSGDFLTPEYWRLRGKLDVPKERFIAFTEIPGRAGKGTVYGWAGWTPTQRLKAILAIDEELEDAGVPISDRTGFLDSAWRLLPEVAREDTTAATRLKAELQALVGPEGPSREVLDAWRERFPPPTTRGGRRKRLVVAREDEGENEESDTL